MPTVTANTVPADWLQRSQDFEARLLRAGLNGGPVIEAPERDAWGAQAGVPTHELLALLLPQKALGARLVDALTKDPSGPLSKTLRSNTAVPMPPTPEEALFLLATTLSHSVKFDAERIVPFDVLRQIGEQGAKLVPDLRAALGSGQRASKPEAEKALASFVNLVAYPNRAALQAALAPRAAATVDAFAAAWPAKPVTATAAVSAVDLSAVKAVTLSNLVDVVTYGSAPVLAAAAKSLGPPATALGELLQKAGARADSPLSLRAALVKVLCQARDPLNPKTIAWDKVGAALGADVAPLADALAGAATMKRPERPNYRAAAELVEELSRTLPANEARPLIDVLVRGNGLLPAKVPALERTARQVPEDALKGHGLVAVQHLFPTTVCLVDACLEKGMKAEEVFLLGTPYATNPLVAAYLRAQGVTVMEAKDSGGATRAFEEHRMGELQQFLGHVTLHARPPNGYVVLDDGGMLATTIAGHKSLAGSGVDAAALQRMFPPSLTATVEQTTRGLTELSLNPLKYDAVAVASSPGKAREGNLVGWSITKSLLQDLKQRGALDRVKQVAIVSAGVIGLNVAGHLKRAGFGVTVHDLDPKKLELARAAGFEASNDLRSALPNTQLVLGATGKRSIDATVLEGWSGIVAQGSSAAIEADRDQIEATRPAPLDWLNRGRPLNFKGDGHELLSAEQIGITQALLFAGVVTAATRPKTADKQLVEVDAKLHDTALKFWEQNGGDTVEKLTRDVVKGAPRPDQAGAGAAHSEWMSFLSSSSRPVCPAPCDTGFVPGLYFFQDDDGSVRQVDTSRHGPLGASASQAVALDVVPQRVVPVDDGQASGWLLELNRGGQVSVLGAKLEGGALELTAERAALSLGAVSTARPTVVDYSGKQKRSAVWDAGDSLVFSFPGSAELHTLKKKLSGGEVLLARPDQEVVLEVRKSPPAVAFNEIFPGAQYARAFAGYQVPRGFAKLEACAALDDTGQRVLVGRTHDGRLAVAPLVPGPLGQAVKLLPEGAVYRGVHRENPLRPWDVTVSYTLPDDPVELQSMRESVLAFG
ncbi:MAG: hypothetical protein JNK82_01010 [Myxococcaceae bacterium]|nr:hypothetical protein [Myxococcaceae bacterium]